MNKKELRYKGKEMAVAVMSKLISEQRTLRLSDEIIGDKTGFTRQHIRTTLNSWDGKLSTVCNIAESLGYSITLTPKTD